MYCPNCGQKLEDNVSFCTRCGISISKNMDLKSHGWSPVALTPQTTHSNNQESTNQGQQSGFTNHNSSFNNQNSGFNNQNSDFYGQNAYQAQNHSYNETPNRLSVNAWAWITFGNGFLWILSWFGIFVLFIIYLIVGFRNNVHHELNPYAKGLVLAVAIFFGGIIVIGVIVPILLAIVGAIK